jgi:hypothetical protein
VVGNRKDRRRLLQSQSNVVTIKKEKDSSVEERKEKSSIIAETAPTAVKEEAVAVKRDTDDPGLSASEYADRIADSIGLMLQHTGNQHWRSQCFKSLQVNSTEEAVKAIRLLLTLVLRLHARRNGSAPPGYASTVAVEMRAKVEERAAAVLNQLNSFGIHELTGNQPDIKEETGTSRVVKAELNQVSQVKPESSESLQSISLVNWDSPSPPPIVVLSVPSGTGTRLSQLNQPTRQSFDATHSSSLAQTSPHPNSSTALDESVSMLFQLTPSPPPILNGDEMAFASVKTEIHPPRKLPQRRLADVLNMLQQKA